MKHLLLTLIVLFKLTLLMGINKYPLDTDYHNWETLGDTLLHYHQVDRLISDIEIIGVSGTEKLPLYAFHIHNLEGIKNKKKKLWERKIKSSVKKVLIIGQHHGEEPMGVEIATSIIKELASSTEQTDLISKYYFVIIPTINPEAFRLVNSGVYPLKRKNNKDTDFNNKFDLKTDGVDLNKNYPSNWELADLNDPYSQYYKGEAPASETEIQAVIELTQRIKFDYAFLYHSSANGTYPEVIFFPYNWGEEKSEDWQAMKEMADALASYLPCFYKSENYHVNSGQTSKYGYARDFLYREYGTFCFTIEVSPITPEGNSLFLPPNKDLKIIVERNKKALFSLLKREQNINNLQK